MFLNKHVSCISKKKNTSCKQRTELAVSFIHFLLLQSVQTGEWEGNGFEKRSSSTKPNSRVLPERRRNEARRSHRQLRASVDIHRDPTVGPTPRRTGSGSGILHGSQVPQPPRVSAPSGLRLPLPPLRSDRRRSRFRPLRPPRRSRHPHRRLPSHRSF